MVRKRRYVKDLIQTIPSHTIRSRHTTWTLRLRLVMERTRAEENGLRLFQKRPSGGNIGNMTGRMTSGGALITGASRRSGMCGDLTMPGDAETCAVRNIDIGMKPGAVVCIEYIEQAFETSEKRYTPS